MRGPVAVMSFDPGVIAALRDDRAAPHARHRGRTPLRPRRMAGMSPAQRAACAFLLHALRTRPHFLAYGCRTCRRPRPGSRARLFGLPLLTWTVRSEEERRAPRAGPTRSIFEGFTAVRPDRGTSTVVSRRNTVRRLRRHRAHAARQPFVIFGTAQRRRCQT